MRPLEQLFRLEVEYHQQLRTAAQSSGQSGSVHTSYAMQNGYEVLIRDIGRVAARDIEALTEAMTLAGDTRDVLNARDSLMRLLGIEQFGPGEKRR